MSGATEVKPHFAWRDAIIGAVISLVVAVVSGFALWALTREPEKSERLIYRIEAPSIFSASGRNVGLQIVNIRNDGKLKSEGVVADVVLPQGTRILDKNVSFESGRSVDFREKNIRGGVSFSIPSLLPNDKASISLLTVGSSGRAIAASVRSQQQIANREQLQQVDGRQNIRLTLALILVALALIAQYGISQYLSYRKFKKRRQEFFDTLDNAASYTPGKNNVGFLFMHSGLLDEAEEVLWGAIKSGDAALMTFSHYAAILALKGDAKADEYMNAAAWPTLDMHEKANLEVDRFIMYATRGDVVKARDSLEKSLAFSRSIKPYYENSKILKDLLNKTSLMQHFYELTKT